MEQSYQPYIQIYLFWYWIYYYVLTITKIALAVVVQFSEIVYPQLLGKQLL